MIVCPVSIFFWKKTLTAILLLAVTAIAQVREPNATESLSSAVVPRLIRIRGTVRDESGKALSGRVAITFSLYKDQDRPDAVWQETQNVQLDSLGHFSTLLGSTSEEGLPLEMFSGGEARWLGVRPENQVEQPRALLLSVPYALKSADTEMLGGKPASAFALAPTGTAQTIAAQTIAGTQQIASTPQQTSAVLNWDGRAVPLTACTSITSDGTATVNQLSKFTSACNIQNSAIFESGGNVGIGNTNPAGALDVAGSTFIRGVFTAQQGVVVPPTGVANATQGFISNPLDVEASVLNTTLGRAANYIWRWQAEPVGNDTQTTSATLNLLYGVSGSISETGISVNNQGVISFAPAQKFPGAGTVTSVASGAGLTGGPITTSGTLSIPTAGVTNAMLANSSVKVLPGSGLSGGGTVALGGSITLSANLAGTSNGIAYFSSPTAVASTAAPTNGQVLIGSTGNAPVLSTITAGSNVQITNKPGSITISAIGGGGAPALPLFVTGGARTGSNAAGVNSVTKLWGFLLPYGVNTTTITYDVTTADNTSNKYDLGIYDNAGNLVVNIGPTAGTTFSAAKAFKTLPWAQGATSLSPGRYYLALTTNCASTCAKIGATSTFVSYAINASAGASQGATLPANVSPPSDSWNTGIQPTVVIQ